MKSQKDKDPVERLIRKGVKIPKPATVDIGDELNLDRISGEGIVLYPGCKIYGKNTLIMSGTKLGYEAPVTIENCQIGPDVELKGGFFKNSVFLEKSSMGSCAHVRDACILEEEASGAHAVGLKHTILFPFVTLGSLINFCDCLMAGGTSRKNHSEVGSSYIHFNYTPNQDKATPSLIGDVPRGVMLDQNPVFLGGQGGLVGPAILGFGTIIAAGGIFRKDFPDGNKLIATQGLKDKHAHFYPGLYLNIKRQVTNNIHYIANLVALSFWYKKARSLFFRETLMGKALLKGALEKLDLAIDERIKRLKEVVRKLPQSIDTYQSVMQEKASQELIRKKMEIFHKWPDIEALIDTMRNKAIEAPEKEAFLEILAAQKARHGNDYIKVIQGLDKKQRAMGTKWLQGIVDRMNSGVLDIIPTFKT